MMLSIIFGFGYTAGEIFVYKPTLHFNFISVAGGLTLSLLYFLIILIFWKYTTNLSGSNRTLKYVSRFREKPFRNTFIILLFSFIPHLIIKYPAGNCPDSFLQILQGLKIRKLTLHAPIFHTMFMTWFVEIGEKIGNPNIGMFGFVVLEMIIMAAVFSYAVYILSKGINTPDIIVLISVLFFSFSPYIIGFVGQPIKDVFFSTGVVLLEALLLDYITTDGFFSKKRNFALLLFSSMSIYLFRKGGLVILLPVFLYIIINEYKKRENNFIKTFIKLIVVLIIPVLVENAMIRIYNPQPGSIREALSIPFQQTARYVKNHGDKITEFEKEAISKVLPFDELPDLYKSYISDPVKDKFNSKASRDDLLNYFKAWFIGFQKEPLCYIRATVEQNIYLIYPKYNNYQYYIDANGNRDYWLPEGSLFTTPENILKLQENYIEFLSDLHTFPILNIVNNMVFYIFCLSIFTVFAVFKRNKVFSALSIPLWTTIIIIIFAPAIRINVRYSFPILWSFPIWFSAAVRPETN